jgi:hypothetical protein
VSLARLREAVERIRSMPAPLLPIWVQAMTTEL